MLLSKLHNSKVAANAGWIIACKLGKAILTLVSTMIISRSLGVEKYGIISYAASIVAFAAPIMKLGINEILVHELVNRPEEEGRVLGTTIVLNLCSSLLCMIGITVFVNFANAGEKTTIIVCMCYSCQLLFQALEMVYYWFQAHLKSKHTSIAILISYFIVVFVQLVLIFIKANIYTLALSYTMEYLITSIILVIFYKKEKGARFSFSFSEAKHLLATGKYYIISGLMVMIFSQTDKIMLKLMCDDTSVGIYSAAVTCANMTSFIFVAIIDSFRPTIFNSYKNTDEFKTKLKSLYSIIIWFSLIQCIVMTLFAPIIIKIIYGVEYAKAINVLQIAVWFTTFSYIGTVRNIWILSYGYQKFLSIINISGAIMNIILNLVLIPFYGAIGAAIASVISQIFTNVIMGYIIPSLRQHNKLMIEAINPKYIVALIKGGTRNGQ